MSKIHISKDDAFTALPDPVYELAKEFFLKRAPGMFFNEKSLSGFESEAVNAIRMAKFFIETYEKSHLK